MQSPRRTGFIAIMALLILTLPLGAVTYVPLVEWNGTHFHVMNSSGIYNLQPVDNPVVDTPFLNPTAVLAWDDATDYCAYVVDSFNDRVQFFTANATYDRETETDWAAFGGGIAAAGNWDNNGVNVINTGNIVRGSERVVVNGVVWTRVASLAAYTASDHVYTAVYTGADANATGVFQMPANSLTASSTVIVTWAETPAVFTAANLLTDDLDFSLAAAATNGAVIGDPFEINEAIPNNAGHPTAFENLVAIAYNTNTGGAAIADVYVLEAGEIGIDVVATEADS